MNYEYFGVMIDCSRNGVMKPKQVMRFIDALAKMGYNMLELYTEDTYEVEGEPYFGYLRGRYTGKEGGSSVVIPCSPHSNGPCQPLAVVEILISI